MVERIDKEKVFQMARMGFTRTAIAERLNCSERQVRRIIKDIESKKNIDLSKSEFNIADEDVEKALRELYSNFESAQTVANRFGISRQAILKGAIK